ncbi:alpha/beta hydrolase [Tahibacter amnicola]|uniref:Alpha/beta hydrolase n=1 Tax=Tahibacter amnicola TaxID=2976241 RepID=A0ABY6BBP0_9GAMM|nr:alpha/beta hydrolase [Tahibacter amnicola]UXI67289.1 alpha/beta hydrolase [Tahibacter amnicola]
MSEGRDRPVVLMIHGAGGGGWEWGIWRRVFAAHGWHVLTPDWQPAAGGLGHTVLDDYVGQMRQIAAQWPGLLLAGASLGGLVAAQIARGAGASGLVLVNSVPPWGIEPHLPPYEGPADVVPWASRRKFASTVRAMPDADAAARLYAYRRWRDESAAVLREAHAGVEVARPDCRCLLIATGDDKDVPHATSVSLAAAWECDLYTMVKGGHVSPLLGHDAAQAARLALEWAQRGR